MKFFLDFTLIFFIGCSFGWCLEVVYRRFSKSNASRKWINPGFLTGPYLPLYGSGLCILFLISRSADIVTFPNNITKNTAVILLMAVCMTVLELITGLVFIKHTNVRLWDYSNEWKNYKGIICPRFSLIWGALGGVYYFFVDKFILDIVLWASGNLMITFALGMFVGVFIIDLGYSANIVMKIKELSKQYELAVKYQELKQQIAELNLKYYKKTHFFRSFKSRISLSEHIKNYIVKKNK